MKKRTALVDLVRDGRVFVKRFSRTENGFNVSDGLPMMLSSLRDPIEVGESVLEALDNANKRMLPAVDPRVPPSDVEFLAFTGFKTCAHYTRGVRTVDVYAEYDGQPGAIHITPMRGTRGGFVPMDDEAVVVAYESPEQLGRAVQEAMKKATR